LLDGHIVLSRRLADAGRYPPIDILRSMSRLMNQIVSREHLANAARVRRAMAALEQAEDLFAIGAYVPGGDAGLDLAVAQRERIERFLFHGSDGCTEAEAELGRIALSLTGESGA
jgi:flagellar biosynthesis/type III secretory pathway ATPase